AMGQKFGRDLRSDELKYDIKSVEFQVESYLRYQGQAFSKSFDANTYLLMTKALDYYDPARAHGGDLGKTLEPVKARFLVISFSTDWRFPPARSRELANALITARKDVSYLEVEAEQGHDAFLLPIPRYIQALGSYMNRIEVDACTCAPICRSSNNGSAPPATCLTWVAAMARCCTTCRASKRSAAT